MSLSIVRGVLLGLVLSTCAFAQTTNATLGGTAADASGALIPGVTVTAINTAQGLQTKTTSDSKGFYTFPRLAVGTYEVQVNGTGFAPQKKSDLAVDADSAVRVDFTKDEHNFTKDKRSQEKKARALYKVGLGYIATIPDYPRDCGN